MSKMIRQRPRVSFFVLFLGRKMFLRWNRFRNVSHHNFQCQLSFCIFRFVHFVGKTVKKKYFCSKYSLKMAMKVFFPQINKWVTLSSKLSLLKRIFKGNKSLAPPRFILGRSISYSLPSLPDYISSISSYVGSHCKISQSDVFVMVILSANDSW